MDRKKEQIQERREFGKASLYRRGRADSVIRLGSNLFAGEAFSACVSSSHLPYFIGISELKRLCFYKKSSGYFYFFPASGGRDFNDGKLYNSGASGYGWSSTPDGGNAWHLDIWSTNAHMNNNNRGYGFPVRCVQASAPVFVFIKNTFVFFPAAGQRHDSNGRLDAVGTWGLVVSSTSSDSRTWTLEFHAGGASVYSDYRSRGYSVRCVQASAAVFAFAKDTFVFFPATGFRGYDDGKLIKSGTWGYEWVSTLGVSGAWGLDFSPAGLGLYDFPRSCGFPVRCVQVSVAVWAVQKENIKQIRYRRESGKASLCRRGQADSVTRLGRNSSAGNIYLPDIAPSYVLTLIRILHLTKLCFYKHSSGYSLFFPAAGIRNYNDGSLRNSGGEGDGWTSTPYNNENAYRFILNSGNANMSNTNRTYGFPVRCVQASAAVFAFSNDTFVFFPAAGIRNNTDGSLTNSGIEGDGWTSVPDGNNAFRLIFKSGYAYVTSVTRMYGFPVRCVQASAAVFAFIKETFVFFPASGNRSPSSGALGSSGTWGYGWPSTPNGSYAYSLCFYSGGAYVGTDSSRGFGFSVRCVQASAAVWAVRKKDLKQIRYRRESGKGLLCRRGQADSVTRLGRKLSVGHSFLPCAALSYLFALIKLPVFECLYFYKHSSGYFLFFPASGYRLNNDGDLRNSGTYGYGWTSTPDGSGGSYVYFFSGGTYVSHYDRDSGRSVRCVQAFAAMFAFSNYLKWRKMAV